MTFSRIRMLPWMPFLFLFFCCPLPSQSFTNSTLSDQNALLAFKKALHSDTLNSLENWNSNHSLCSWRGVICSSRPKRAVRVVSLNLTGMKLTGPISPFIGNLSFLRVLSLKKNSFEGQIPDELGRLSRLRKLILSKNQLHGPIPSALAACHSLQFLSLFLNYLTGSIPFEVGRLPNLKVVLLEVNQLTGRIPIFISSNITELDLGRNKFHGGIPSHLRFLHNLELLGLNTNQFTGQIPSFIGNMSSLTVLDLSENRLHGQIPPELGSLSQMRELYLLINDFTGEIPTPLFNCSHLQLLELSDTGLVGHIPGEFGSKFPELQELYLGQNHLTGDIPGSLANRTLLQVLELQVNQLSGLVPVELGNLAQLTRLYLQENQLVSGSNTTLLALTIFINSSLLQEIDLSGNFLTGVLPSSIGQLSTELSNLDLHSNQIEGRIPDEIGNLTNLTHLDLSWNSFNGTIPSTFNTLSRLQRLYINGNKLNGRIPNNLGQLKSHLGLLDLSHNMLWGQIPDSFGQLQQLRYLYLHYNQLSGRIPANLGSCFILETLDLSYNRLTGKIPPELAGLRNLQFHFNLSNNLLQGSLPLQISNLVMVQAIDVSHNNLSGLIPSLLESCVALEYLNLSQNALQGPIPVSLANLKNLEDLDISSNRLNGSIPMALETLKNLQHLNFSSNKLEGEVPKHGIFAMLDASALRDNPGLCGPWIGLPPCFQSKHQQHWLLTRVIIPSMMSIAVVIACFLFIFFRWRRKCENPNAFALKFGPKRISYEELIDATSGFSEANLLGTGTFGSVYRGILNDGTNIAVKVLKLQHENAHRSFSRECDALKRVRHRNVIRIISTCSTHDFKLLILPFMPNGSLESWLYPDGEDESKLNLTERLRIALEVAQGLEYLHHHCLVQVVHCDLKPRNVLLGDDMVAYLADFGISRLIFGTSVSSLSSMNALEGSIGYMAPEYGVGAKIGTNGDVYSYGILLLELMTRRKPTDNNFVGGLNLSKWVRMHFPNGITEVVDNSLLRDVNESEESRVRACLTQLLQIGLVCAGESPQERPTMMEIVKRLEKVKHTLLGTPRSFELPVNILSLLEDTSRGNNAKPGNDQSWSSSTI